MLSRDGGSFVTLSIPTHRELTGAMQRRLAANF